MRRNTAVLFVLFILFSLALFCRNTPSEVTGIWKGSLEVQGTSLPLVVHIEKDDRGKLTGTIDSPGQGAFGIPITTLSLQGMELVFTVDSIGGRYQGALRKDGKTITGEWSQGGLTLPLSLERTKEAPARTPRPQEPSRPYPYLEEEVRYPNPAAGIHLAGTLTLPQTGGPFAAAILITGSGSQDRDETVANHKPFLVLADHLTRKGIAVLRADDRGVGESGGDPTQSTTLDFAGDVLAGVRFLKKDPRIDPRRIGLIGHSEGGLIAPICAKESGDVAFIVLMAGPGLTGEEIILLQSRLIAEAEGMPPEKIEENLQEQRRVFEILKQNPDHGTAEAKLKELMHTSLKKLQGKEREQALARIPQQLNQILSPWFRFFITHDPAGPLREVDCPVLAINGEKDLQVPPRQNLEAIARALKKGGNRRFTLREIPGVNHLFQTCETGAPSEYAAIQETMAQEVLQQISHWILKQINH